ncbi:pteridine reductase [bacterium endosymbiont of Bathymodiolus sp. 5 South]|jgi:pteridine reductase|uniref:pteridine reductase n=1 Tax=bacterium endosymbiont of Bathymodiolus sp. 5 South TaxID=1181670 RepID=UPI0010B78B69|nr:pteridine reductase [bacterium endosymbiont of Bathymodiolus sp. 5 South]CAC9638982.1 FolM Alternative dihydrofolate reductase 1 [uncultured Gammaproteobacteria bacterium]CAC9647114.1 FolM Alternative dihydrofolate reductase 1 [uncultured Gammaproteobacteria bacterium]SHN89395.1 FolM Alternative dihydrofolate reductase 1 [bacterium endosymbiont of Bathymodiolus sp. 5 South]SSC07029.1 FolM Alternative dihydrofolate reductase 1 [bacterium endosymbiont of Bathymodiolus sp. 5 South]VVH56618.1 F
MKTALITGGAQRIGAQITRTLHAHDYNIVIHYRNSNKEAQTLADELNQLRANSVTLIQAELSDLQALKTLADTIKQLDILVNNASLFYPTSIQNANENDWNTIINTNLTAPFFLSQSLSSTLSKNKGCIINIVDIHAQRPLKNHAIYNISKAGLAMMTQTLAKELAPEIRVCGVAPGSILWPENQAKLNDAQKDKMLNKIPLNKQGSPEDIANTVLFLANSPYITGQIISVDGGRTLNQ